MKNLPANHLGQIAEYQFTTYCIGTGKAPALPEGTSIADLFRPQFWANHAKTLRIGDLVRVRAKDGAFDIWLTPTGIEPGAVIMDFFPKFPDAAQLMAASDLAKSIDAVRTELVPRKIAGKDVPRVEHTKATGWRIIGLDGHEHSRDYQSEAAAIAAMNGYLRKAGFTHMADPAPVLASDQPLATTKPAKAAKKADEAVPAV